MTASPPLPRNLPLHASGRQHYQNFDACPDRHMGLWRDKFFDTFDANFALPKPLQCINKDVVLANADGAAFVARQDALVSALGGKARDFSTEWRLAIGLGNPHPSENGFVWHPTLGVPYLPSSSIKGLLRAWLVEWCGGKDEIKRADFWLGPENGSAAGAVVIFDGIPLGPVTIGPDVMTPHYGPWYEGEDAGVAPADWHNPVPVSFLVVKQAAFRIHAAPRFNSRLPAAELDCAFGELEAALQHLGAGAKTSGGYGRLSPV